MIGINSQIQVTSKLKKYLPSNAQLMIFKTNMMIKANKCTMIGQDFLSFAQIWKMDRTFIFKENSPTWFPRTLSFE